MHNRTALFWACLKNHAAEYGYTEVVMALLSDKNTDINHIRINKKLNGYQERMVASVFSSMFERSKIANNEGILK